VLQILLFWFTVQCYKYYCSDSRYIRIQILIKVPNQKDETAEAYGMHGRGEMHTKFWRGHGIGKGKGALGAVGLDGG